MRDSIVSPIEQALAGTTDLQTINATVQQGQATISAVYTINSDLATDLSLTQKAIESAQKNLPTNLTPPTVNIRDPSESTVITLAMYSHKLSPGQLSLFADNVIVPRIEQIQGVSYVNVGRRRHARVRSARRSGPASRGRRDDQRRHRDRLER